MPLSAQQVLFAAQEAAARRSYERNTAANETMKAKAQAQLATAARIGVANVVGVPGNDRALAWNGKGRKPAPAPVVATPAPAPAVAALEAGHDLDRFTHVSKTTLAPAPVSWSEGVTWPADLAPKAKKVKGKKSKR